MAENVVNKIGGDSKMLVTLIIFVLVIILGMWAWRKWGPGAPPMGSISPAQYAALSAADQALYKMDPNGSGYYVKI